MLAAVYYHLYGVACCICLFEATDNPNCVTINNHVSFC